MKIKERMRGAGRRCLLLTLAVTCANVYGGCSYGPWRFFFVQLYQFDPELAPEGEAPEDIQTLCLQRWFQSGECVRIMSVYSYVLLQLLTCS